MACEYSASVVFSWNTVVRKRLLSHSASALSSVVQPFSGLRPGLVTRSVPALPWNSSPTVGTRMARPVASLTAHTSLACQPSAALGESQLSLRSWKGTGAAVPADLAPPQACQRS